MVLFLHHGAEGGLYSRLKRCIGSGAKPRYTAASIFSKAGNTGACSTTHASVRLHTACTYMLAIIAVLVGGAAVSVLFLNSVLDCPAPMLPPHVFWTPVEPIAGN